MKRLVEKLALKGFKPFFWYYYRSLFGRPHSEKLAKRVLAWERRTGRRNVPISQEEWEKEYRGGEWDFLHGIDELARYSVIVGFLHHTKPGGSVLDVGSGEGVLLEKLLPYGVSRYTGIDVSEVAVEKGRARGFENATFEVADAETYAPAETFDAVVFNECLYYFHDPLDLAERAFRDWMSRGGVVMASQFEAPRSAAISRELHKRLPVLGQTRVVNARGTWIVDLFGEAR